MGNTVRSIRVVKELSEIAAELRYNALPYTMRTDHSDLHCKYLIILQRYYTVMNADMGAVRTGIQMPISRIPACVGGMYAVPFERK